MVQRYAWGACWNGSVLRFSGDWNSGDRSINSITFLHRCDILSWDSEWRLHGAQSFLPPGQPSRLGASWLWLWTWSSHRMGMRMVFGKFSWDSLLQRLLCGLAIQFFLASRSYDFKSLLVKGVSAWQWDDLVIFDRQTENSFFLAVYGLIWLDDETWWLQTECDLLTVILTIRYTYLQPPSSNLQISKSDHFASDCILRFRFLRIKTPQDLAPICNEALVQPPGFGIFFFDPPNHQLSKRAQTKTQIQHIKTQNQQNQWINPPTATVTHRVLQNGHRWRWLSPSERATPVPKPASGPTCTLGETGWK